MPFFEENVLKDSIEIKTSAERIFNFLTSIVDDDSYRSWHEEDHVKFQWVSGNPWTEGAIVYAEEFIHGKLHKFRFIITKVVPNKKIEYSPTSRFIKKFFPKNEFIIEQKEESCLFIASGTYRVGVIGRFFFKNAIEKGLSSVRKHISDSERNINLDHTVLILQNLQTAIPFGFFSHFITSYNTEKFLFYFFLK